MKKVVKADSYKEYANDTADLDEREYADRKVLKSLKRKMQDLFDTLEETRANFVEEHHLEDFYNMLSDTLYDVAHELEPFDGVTSSTKVTAASTGVKIPAPFDKYYRVATAANLDDFDEELSPCEECEGYDAKNVGWAIAKDEYADALANSSLDCVELVKFDGDNETKLCYAVHDRIYEVDEDEILDCVE